MYVCLSVCMYVHIYIYIYIYISGLRRGPAQWRASPAPFRSAQVRAHDDRA